MFKNQDEMTCFFLLQSSLNKKNKIGTIPITFLNGKQQTKRQSHTQNFCTLHSTKEEDWNNFSHFSKWQGTKNR